MFGAGSGAVQGAVQAREPPLDTMAPCVRFGAGSAGSAVPLPTTIDNVNSLYMHVPGHGHPFLSSKQRAQSCNLWDD